MFVIDRQYHYKRQLQLVPKFFGTQNIWLVGLVESNVILNRSVHSENVESEINLYLQPISPLIRSQVKVKHLCLRPLYLRRSPVALALVIFGSVQPEMLQRSDKWLCTLGYYLSICLYSVLVIHHCVLLLFTFPVKVIQDNCGGTKVW